MRLVTFQFVDRQPQVGVLLGSAVIDLAAAAPLVFEDPPSRPGVCSMCWVACRTVWGSMARRRS